MIGQLLRSARLLKVKVSKIDKPRSPLKLARYIFLIKDLSHLAVSAQHWRNGQTVLRNQAYNQ